MIIVLNGADFSDNNIGKVVLDKELSAEAKKILSHYTKPLSQTQQIAFDNFLTSLKASGIWSKTNNLYFPILAGNLGECWYDVISGKTTIPSSTTGYGYDSKGLRVVTAAETSEIAINTDGVNAPVGTNCHFCTYSTEAMVSGYYLGSNGKSVTYWLGAATASGTLIGENTAGVKTTPDSNAILTKGLKIASNSGSDGVKAHSNYSGIPSSAGFTIGTPNIGGKLGGLYLGYAASNTPNATRQGMFGWGTYLTADELAIYSQVADDFFNVMLAE